MVVVKKKEEEAPKAKKGKRVIEKVTEKVYIMTKKS